VGRSETKVETSELDQRPRWKFKMDTPDQRSLWATQVED